MPHTRSRDVQLVQLTLGNFPESDHLPARKQPNETLEQRQSGRLLGAIRGAVA